MKHNIKGQCLESTKQGKNYCSWYDKNKGRINGTKQLSLFPNDAIGSHNIYFIKNTCPGKLLQKSANVDKSKKPGKSVWLNVFGQADILKVYVDQINSYYKDDYSNVWIELSNQLEPILLRNSISEIENKIIRSK